MDILNYINETLNLTSLVKDLAKSLKDSDNWFQACLTDLTSIYDAMDNYKKHLTQIIPNSFYLLHCELNIFKEFLEKEIKKPTKNQNSNINIVKSAQEQMRRIEKEIHNFYSILNESNEKFKLLTIREWNSLTDFIFSKSKGHDKDYLIFSPPIPKKILTITSPIVLKIIKNNKNDSKKYTYPIGYEFFISEEKVIFTNYEGKEIVYIKNLEKDPLIFGKYGPTYCCPDVHYDYEMVSIIEKQFQILLKKSISFFGFYITNLSLNGPTSLKIGKIPYIIGSQMIFDLSDTLIEVTEIDPEPSTNLNEDDPDYFFINFDNKQYDISDDLTMKMSRRKKGKISDEDGIINKKKNNNPLPYIILKVIQGNDENSDAFKFNLTHKKENKEIRIGSKEKNDIIIKDADDIQLKIIYDPTLSQWVAISDEENERIKEYNGTYLYLIQSSEWKEKTLHKQKISVKLRDKMKIAFNSNEIEVLMK